MGDLARIMFRMNTPFSGILERNHIVLLPHEGLSRMGQQIVRANVKFGVLARLVVSIIIVGPRYAEV